MANIKTGRGTIRIRRKACNCANKEAAALSWREFYHGMRLVFMLMLGVIGVALVISLGAILVYLVIQAAVSLLG